MVLITKEGDRFYGFFISDICGILLAADYIVVFYFGKSKLAQWRVIGIFLNILCMGRAGVDMCHALYGNRELCMCQID